MLKTVETELKNCQEIPKTKLEYSEIKLFPRLNLSKTDILQRRKKVFKPPIKQNVEGEGKNGRLLEQAFNMFTTMLTFISVMI